MVTVRRLVLADLRHSRASFIGVFVAVLIATALITGLGVLFESGFRGGLEPQRLAGAPIVVSGPQTVDVIEDADLPLAERAPLPKDATSRIAAMPEVEKVIGDRSVPVLVGGRPVIAHGWQSVQIAGLEIVDGRAPAAHGEAVVADGTGLSVGDRTVVDRAGRRVDVTVVGTVDDLGRSDDRPSDVYLGDKMLATIAPGSARVLAVVPREGESPESVADRIRGAFPGIEARTGSSRGDTEFRDAGAGRAALIGISAAFAGTCLLVALFVVSGTLSLSVQSRHRDFALLRAVGASGRQIRGIVTREVLLVAVLGAATGVVPGYLLAGVLQWGFVEGGVIPSDFELATGPLPAVVGCGSVLVAAVVAGLLAARRPAKLDPVDALRDAAAPTATPHKARLVAGVLLGVGGLVASAGPVMAEGEAARASSAGAAMLLIIAVALLGPWLMSALTAVVGAVLRSTGAPAPVLAAESARHDTRRFAAAVTPLALGIGLGLVQLGAPAITAEAASTEVRVGVTADLAVRHPGGLAPEVIDDLRAIRGVLAVNPLTATQAVAQYRMVDDDRDTRSTMSLTGVDPESLPATLDVDVRSGDLARLAEKNTVAVSTDFASTARVDVGGRLVGFFGDGAPLDATVVAVYTRGLGFGAALMADDTVRAHTESGVSTQALLSTEPGADVASRVSDMGLTAVAPSDDPADRAEAEQQGWVNTIALVVILGYIAVAVVNTLVMATTQRRRDFALLRLVGAKRQQIRSMMRIESLLVAGAALVLGLLVAAPPLVGLSIGMGGSAVPTLPLVGSVVVVGAMCGIGLAAQAVGTRVAMRGAEPGSAA